MYNENPWDSLDPQSSCAGSQATASSFSEFKVASDCMKENLCTVNSNRVNQEFSLYVKSILVITCITCTVEGVELQHTSRKKVGP